MYRIETDQDALLEVDALPPAALSRYAEVLSLLEIAPWSGDSYNVARPDGSMRAITFGEGVQDLVVYLVLEDQRRVVVLRVVWLTRAPREHARHRNLMVPPGAMPQAFVPVRSSSMLTSSMVPTASRRRTATPAAHHERSEDDGVAVVQQVGVGARSA